MSKLTYDDAIKFFSAQTDLWEAFCDGLQERRDSYIGDVKRNMSTPNCSRENYFASNGAMVAMDDLVLDLRNAAEETKKA